MVVDMPLGCVNWSFFLTILFWNPWWAALKGKANIKKTNAIKQYKKHITNTRF